jgi:hypothetical protein
MLIQLTSSGFQQIRRWSRPFAIGGHHAPALVMSLMIAAIGIRDIHGIAMCATIPDIDP